MLNDIEEHFGHVLQPASENFNLLPAAACLLDPCIAIVLLTEDMKPLMEAAKNFIFLQVTTNNNNNKIDSTSRTRMK